MQDQDLGEAGKNSLPQLSSPTLPAPDSSTQPTNYLSADDARTALKKWTLYDIFQSIRSKCDVGAHDLHLERHLVTDEIINALESAGYNVHIGGIDDAVVVVEW